MPSRRSLCSKNESSRPGWEVRLNQPRVLSSLQICEFTQYHSSWLKHQPPEICLSVIRRVLISLRSFQFNEERVLLTRAVLCRALPCTSGSSFWHFKQASAISQAAQMPASCKPSQALLSIHRDILSTAKQQPPPAPANSQKKRKCACNLPGCLVFFSSFLSFSFLCHFHSEMDHMCGAKMCRWTRWLPETRPGQCQGA